MYKSVSFAKTTPPAHCIGLNYCMTIISTIMCSQNARVSILSMSNQSPPQRNELNFPTLYFYDDSR